MPDTSFLYFPAPGTIRRGDTTVGDKGKPHNGLLSVSLSLSQLSEGSSPAPGPECSLRLEKVSKVTPLRESKLTSEGLLRQQPENGWCDKSQGGTCHPGRSLRLSIELSIELDFERAAHTFPPHQSYQAGRKFERSSRPNKCARKRWANFAASKFWTMAERDGLPMTLLRLGSEGPEPRHGEAIYNVKPRPRCSWTAG